ncbi:MAG: OmpH family outer membrane protein [Bacteroidales bacterium]|jgi:outer membrane protein|nr:OmpH family outer membrane protein [Bacteroidales bacterium]
MKTILKFVLVIAIVALCSNVSAQTLKLAHININELVVSMSEYDSAMVKMQKIQKQLESEMETLQVEYRRKLDDYTKNEASLTDIVKQSRQQELVGYQQRLQTFSESAQQTLEDENNKLMQPVLEKANKAIETVAKEQGITYVLSAQAVLYKAIDSVDLLPAVKQHMGIKK